MQALPARFPNGVDGDTGRFLTEPDLDGASRGLPRLGRTTRGLDDNIDPKDLSKTGWGVVFSGAAGEAKEIRQALQPLLDLRKAQAGNLYKDLQGSDGYSANDDNLTFIGRQKAGPGRVVPSRVPYYLLLVGNPEDIPYDFQYQLDQQHAVGRICFDDLDDYARYAASVIAAETVTPRSVKEVALFGPLQDEGTVLTNNGLLDPILSSLRSRADCNVRRRLGTEATKPALIQTLAASPDLLFTAGHGVFYSSGHARQKNRQGAIVCQEWPGPGTPPEDEHVFAGDDLKGSGELRGLLAFLFACNSAGTPALSDYVPGRPAAPQPFVSKLAQRFLAQGGAQAVVGHVEQVWQCSFLWRDTGFQPQAFVQVVHRLLDGNPLGWAMEPLADRFADLAATLLAKVERKDRGLFVDDEELEALRIAMRDARNYVIVGDPAVRLRRVGKKRIMRG